METGHCTLCGTVIYRKDVLDPEPRPKSLKLYLDGYWSFWCVCDDCYQMVRGPRRRT